MIKHEHPEAILSIARHNGWAIGLTNGCFDLLHNGHIALLKQAKQRCRVLVVALNDDESVRRLKGGSRPIQSLKQRKEALLNTDLVDIVMVFHTETELFQLVADIKPDFLFKGADYIDRAITGGSFMKKNKKSIVLVPILEGYSTTKTIALGGTGC